MKKIIKALVLIMVLLVVGCSKEEEPLHENPVIAEKLEEDWQYTSTNTSYKPTYNSEYWNYFAKDEYSKMYYEALLNTDFSDSMQKNIYLFYEDKTDKYSLTSFLKAILFARLDHPEYELMDFDFGVGSYLNKEEGLLFQSLSYACMDYDEYSSKLAKVNAEIEDLVDEVNSTKNVIEKHRLIFNWLTSNVTYLKSGTENGTVGFYENEYLLERLETQTTQNVYGAIVEKKAICDGIADAYKYICNCCNLECMIIDGYIGDIEEERYHAWNIVKINNNWYLIDATWGLEESDYFLVDLNKGNRTPFDIGYDLPGYDFEEKESNLKLTFDNSSFSNLITSTEGVKFQLENEYYKICPSQNGIYSCLDFEKPNGKEEYGELLIKTNAPVKKLEYFGYDGALLGISEEKAHQYVLPDYFNDTYIFYMNIYLEYKGKTYKVEMAKGGA